MLSWPLPKDPDDVCDYQFDWSQRLEDGETISTSVFTVDEGTVVIDSDTTAGAITTVWLSGGVAGERCIITNRVTTSGNRQYDWSARLRIKSTS